MLRRIGQMMSLTCFSGPYRNTAEARASLPKSWTRMTGYRLLVSSQEEMIPSVSTNLTKTKSRPSKKVIGSKERTKSSSNLFERTVPSSGHKSPTNSTLALVSPVTGSSVERDGLIS
jgi:hypothetical protein